LIPNELSKLGLFLSFSEKLIYCQLQFNVSGAHVDKTKKKSTIPPLKGTVSPDIGLYFRFSKIKSELSTGPLIDFTLIYFVVP
jgi:hypothetical protein